MAKKNYHASTGVDEFYYGIIGDGTKADKVYRVEFLQEIEVEADGEIEKAYGDNKTAELAFSQGDTTVTAQFHKIPLEDQKRLFGYEEQDGIVARGSTDAPEYVAVVFAKTFEDGTREYVGLPKGMFMPPSVEGETKEDSTEFSSQEIEAEFMDREVEGFADEKNMLTLEAKDGKDDEKRDDLFEKLFGKEYEVIKDSDDDDEKPDDGDEEEDSDQDGNDESDEEGENDDGDGDESGEA